MNNEMPHIIAFSGYARAGKDTAALAPLFQTKWNRVSFAAPLKSDIMSMLVGASKRAALPSEDWPSWNWFNDEEKKETLRPLLVAYGAAWRALSNTFWVDRLDKTHIRRDHAGKVIGEWVITDLRYKNEADWVRKNGGVVIGITRPGTLPANPEERRSFEEFTADYTVHNNGSKQDLWDRVTEVLSGCTRKGGKWC